MSYPDVHQDFAHQSDELLDTSLLLDTMTLLPINNNSNMIFHRPFAGVTQLQTPLNTSSRHHAMLRLHSVYYIHPYPPFRPFSSSNQQSFGRGMSLVPIHTQAHVTAGTYLDPSAHWDFWMMTTMPKMERCKFHFLITNLD